MRIPTPIRTPHDPVRPRAGAPHAEDPSIEQLALEADDFTGRDDFIDALRTGVVHGRLAGHGIHFQTRYDKLRKWLGRHG